MKLIAIIAARSPSISLKREFSSRRRISISRNILWLRVLLGDVGVGKSSLLLRFVKDQFVEFQESTIGAAFFSQTLAVNDATVKFEIWDTAGQERYHSLAPMYYRGAAAAIIVFDITNQCHRRHLRGRRNGFRNCRHKDIVMYVNSPGVSVGGSVTAGNNTFPANFDQHIRPDVSTVCLGLVLEPKANEMLHHKANLNGSLAYHTGQSLGKIKQDTDRDFFMSAKEAKEYGLLDGVIMNPLTALQPLAAA
ncbi:unnamed protein product [Thlaspi arvense]|uniref:ATP-dependent Clp protease proteolytic subunit n=1 Tax=Thlaspi arvense TaxID=13288 RepID=A0AAU9SD26_THLAR|nr:unnamed protein product [Thlaspi arvense]